MSEPAVSIVILVHDGLELLAACLDSVRRHTAESHELIIVDNGSTQPHMRAYLEREKSRGVRVLRFGSNLGFAAGNNRALKAAGGRFVLLLNSDTVVTEGWLSRMLSVMDADPEIGMVGPRTNYAGGKQGEGGADHYATEDGLALWARHVGRADAGQRQYVGFLSGFCLLVRRECMEGIGPGGEFLDPLFDQGMGMFGDNDISLRASIAGYRLAIALDAWVHHTGSATFRALGIA